MRTRSKQSELLLTVQRLDRELRLWKRCGALLFLMAVGAFCAGSRYAQDIPDVVAAKKGFVVTDKNGQIRSYFGFEEDGRVGMYLTDRMGKKRVGLGVNPQDDGYGVVVYDKEERLRAFLGLVQETYCLHFYDERSVPRTTVGHKPSAGFSGIITRDEKGQHRVMLGEVARENGRQGAGLFLLDEKTQSRLQLYAIDGGWPVLQFMDKDEKPRIRLGLEGGERSVFSMRDKQADERVVIEVGADNSLKFETKDKTNKVTRSVK